MEICNTYNNVTGRGEGRGKAPTRLQQHAPACLQLDQTAGTASTNPLLDGASMAIPLLSPVLILSPQPMPESSEKGGDQNVRSIAPPFSAAGGWQHPAVAPFTDPSSLFAVFQSQCMIANQAQWHLRFGFSSVPYEMARPGFLIKGFACCCLV